MKEAICKVDVEEGKYTFAFFPGDYRIYVYRNGEHWLVLESGCKAILALMQQAQHMIARAPVVECHTCETAVPPKPLADELGIGYRRVEEAVDAARSRTMKEAETKQGQGDVWERLRNVVKNELDTAAHCGSVSSYQVDEVMLHAAQLTIARVPVVECHNRLVVVWDPERERYQAFSRRLDVPHGLFNRVTSAERAALETLT